MPVIAEFAGQWTRWFAWRPVRAGRSWIWLRTIERRNWAFIHEGKSIATGRDYRRVS